jgi:hypothetical protein
MCRITLDSSYKKSPESKRIRGIQNDEFLYKRTVLLIFGLYPSAPLQPLQDIHKKQRLVNKDLQQPLQAFTRKITTDGLLAINKGYRLPNNEKVVKEEPSIQPVDRSLMSGWR